MLDVCNWFYAGCGISSDGKRTVYIKWNIETRKVAARCSGGGVEGWREWKQLEEWAESLEAAKRVAFKLLNLRPA